VDMSGAHGRRPVLVLGIGNILLRDEGVGVRVIEQMQTMRLPDDVEPIAFTPLGYPSDQPGTKRRKALAELVRYEHW